MSNLSPSLHNYEPHETTLANFVGAIAMAISIFQLTGIINNIMESLKRGQSLIKFEANHIYLILAETACWSIYGLNVKAFPIYLTNAALFLIYLACYLLPFYLSQDYPNLGKHGGIIIAAWAIGYSMLPKNLTGFGAFLLKLATCYYTYLRIKYSLLRKTNENLDINELYAGAGGYFVWVVYALFLAYFPFVWIPNLAFLLLYSMALITYFWTVGKIMDDGILIVYVKKIFQVETVSDLDHDPKQMKKKLRDDF